MLRAIWNWILDGVDLRELWNIYDYSHPEAMLRYCGHYHRPYTAVPLICNRIMQLKDKYTIFKQNLCIFL